MSIKKFLVLVVLIVSSTVLAQESLNSYKYVIVPQKYDFLKSENQYQLNSLTKFLFKKEGFMVLFDDDTKPQDLASDPCLGLVAKVASDSSLFTTKLQLALVNCRNEVVFSGLEGKSKQKDYKKAYHEALRNAFQSVTALHYDYVPDRTKVAVKEQIKEQEEIEVPESVEVIVEEEGVVESEKIERSVTRTNTEGTRVEEVKEEVVEVPFQLEEENHLDTPPETPEVSIPENKQEKAVETVAIIPDTNMLYAQANILGYQLVDSTPKVVYVLLKSARTDVYFLRNKKGVVYKENGQWVAEYYDLDTLVRKSLNIKF